MKLTLTLAVFLFSASALANSYICSGLGIGRSQVPIRIEGQNVSFGPFELRSAADWKPQALPAGSGGAVFAWEGGFHSTLFRIPNEAFAGAANFRLNLTSLSQGGPQQFRRWSSRCHQVP